MRVVSKGCVYQRRGSGNWFLKFYVDGVVKRESSGTTNRAKAEIVLQRRIEEVVRGLYQDVGQRITFAEMKELLVRNYAFKQNRTDPNRFIDQLAKSFGDLLGEEITEERITAHSRKRLEVDGAKPATLHRELAVLRRMLRLASPKLPRVPLIDMPRVNNARQGFFEEEDLQAILPHLAPHARELVEFLYLTGWRSSEAFRLQWSDIDWKRRVVKLRDSKNREPRIFPFKYHARVEELLKRQREAVTEWERLNATLCPSVFHWKGKPIQKLRRSWTTACRKAGMPGRLVHDFRRTAVRNLIRANVQQAIAMKITGHKTSSIFRRYLIVDEELLAQATGAVADYLGKRNATTPTGRRSSPCLTPPCGFPPRCLVSSLPARNRLLVLHRGTNVTMPTSSRTESKPRSASELMISVAGIRGIVGDSLTPDVVARFVAAFAHELPPGPVVVGRDARPTGPMVLRAALAGLTAAGRDVVDVGLATTPATQLAVEHLRAAGGVILTASHNPVDWNALKFLSSRGEFVDAAVGARVRARYEANRELWVSWDRVGAVREESDALDWHLARVLGLEFIDVAAIRARRLKVVVDGCASVGGIAVPLLLRELGADVVEHDCVPNGKFTRVLEPLPEHLGALGAVVAKSGADFGIAVDPDADRAAFVDGSGTPLGEEYTVALGTAVVLPKQNGPVVTNLSTSQLLDAVCSRHGVTLHRTSVGEANVVSAMRDVNAVAGGEGNGGMILPAAHYGRDSLVAAALIAQAMAASGRTLRELADELPRYHMVKEKIARPDTPWERAAEQLREAFPDYHVDESDGLRFSRDQEWLHVRASGTEPVVRVIAESPSEPRTRTLVDHARRTLLAATSLKEH